MQSHLCPAVDPASVQRAPRHQSPRLPRQQLFGPVLVRCPRCCPHASPSLFQPLTDPPHVQTADPVLRRRTSSFAICPHQPFQLALTPTRPSSRAGFVTGPFSHLSVCRYCPLCARAPAFPSCSLRGSLCPSVFPQPSVGCT